MLSFSNISIPLSQVFLNRSKVYSMVNLKPFVPGHVLICTKRVVSKLEDLNEDQIIEIFSTAQEVSQKLSKFHGQYEMILQNGKQAGQTVPHVHLHLVPKKRIPGLQRINDEARTADDMANEAQKYRAYFQSQIN